MADRTKRLREALPDVTKAVRNQKVFHDEANTVWTHLRRGLTDLKKEPEKLDSLELPSDSTIDDVWEFMLDLMVDHPKYSRQILDAVDFLLCSERWGEGFLQAKQKHRLSLWKLKGKKDQEPSPVSLTIHLLQNGVAVDELLPLTALDNGSAFVEELASELKGDLRRQLEESELGAALREAREAKCASPLPEGNSVEDLQALAATNQAQADNIVAAGTADKRPGCRKEIVENLLEVFEEALEFTGRKMKVINTGYEGEFNIATSAMDKLAELKNRHNNLQAQLVIMGPGQVGKTSLTYALVGFAALPPAAPSMLCTRWVHTPGLVVPRMSMCKELVELLSDWSQRLIRLPQAADIEVPAFKSDVEGVEPVAAALETAHRAVYRCRSLGVVSAEELAKLSRPAMCLQVEVGFSPLIDLEEELTDTGLLSLLDMPSGVLWAIQDVHALHSAALNKSDGVLVVVDASKHDVPHWMGKILREALKQEHDEEEFQDRGSLRPADCWIVANRIDQLPEFFCKENELCKKVMQRQYQNYRDLIVSEDHVIPVAARLSSLAMYGTDKVRSNLSQEFQSLEKKPWFAQTCGLMFGMHWQDQARDLEHNKWRSAMRELKLLGQVTGPLANSVLKTAYVKMMPHSVARVMGALSNLAWNFCSALTYMAGADGLVKVETVHQICRTFQEDVEQRITACLAECVPTEEEAKALATRKCPKGTTFDGPDATDLHQKFFEIAAREAVAEFQPSFERAKVRCKEEVHKAHNKFLKTMDYYLTRDNLDPFAKHKLVAEAMNTKFVLGEGASPLSASDRDKFVSEQVKQVKPTVHWHLFQRASRTYDIPLDLVVSFETALLELWSNSAHEQLTKLFLEPIFKSFEKLKHDMEEFNRRPRRKDSKVQFAFGPKLAEVLKEIRSFKAPDNAEDAVPQNEAERCEKLCLKIRETIQQLS